ncbi:cyclophilin-like protein [Kribbella sp. VKM Ac-2527]|uniref:Cyclophilin-like protein n=1 Tax=Kribbella caucasensis TaxID=2512215 RepID=A0A4R6KKV0_9ACTN|nr:cyclophilin-like fold protein [Kribbella sp. VKM Ac-2527]TDO51618.1 cyclophilin-like protein [Kribbella sp. VKM Ac-2527]TDO51621.1 cyclophilin-like protein [Kribbella sp. VKM Ac-2527]
MNIRLTIDGRAVDATLNDSAAARDLAAQFPLTLNLEDFHQTERIAYPPRRLSTTSAPTTRPRAGDLAYYVPWGNIAIYYRDGDSSSSDVIILGHINADSDVLANATRLTIDTAS